jgi:phosphomannomutase/phosphoglucomutase
VIDCANSIVGPLALSLFDQLGYEIIPLFCQPDGNFPNHDPNPSDEDNLQSPSSRSFIQSSGSWS